MTEIALTTLTPNYSDWLAYGKARFNANNIEYETAEKATLEASAKQIREKRREMVFRTISSFDHVEGIKQSTLSNMTRYLDHKTRADIVLELIETKRIEVRKVKPTRGPSYFVYNVAVRPSG